MPRLSFIAPLALAALVAGSSAWAQDPPRAKVTELFKQPYLEQPGKQVRAFSVEFPPHAVSRNDSDTEPLQLVVFYVSEPGAAVSVPLAK